MVRCEQPVRNKAGEGERDEEEEGAGGGEVRIETQTERNEYEHLISKFTRNPPRPFPAYSFPAAARPLATYFLGLRETARVVPAYPQAKKTQKATLLPAAPKANILGRCD